jgi:uncharacterized protein YndB with AHSA1/START domain
MATTLKNKKELTITRIFDVPRELVWKAWVEPERIKKWWGPQYFTAPFIKNDVRVGGKYLYSMRGPDGKDYWSTGIYREIVPLERLVVTDSFSDKKGKVVPASHYGLTGDFPLELLVTVTFEAIGNKTKMILRHEGIPEGQMKDLTQAGWSGSFDKLAESIVPSDHTRIIAEPGKPEVVVTREVYAPRYQVFRAHTDPALVPEWWGAARFTTVIDKMDAKPGGLWRLAERDAAGAIKYAFHGVYHDIVSPERIVSTFEYEGAPGRVSLKTTKFDEIGGRTKITSRTVFQTVEDRDEALKAGMEECILEGMDRLTELLGKLKIEKKAA